MFRSHLSRLSTHSLFEYVWLSVLRVLLFYEQHDEIFSAVENGDASENLVSVLNSVPDLLSSVLNDLETAGLFSGKLDATKQLSHRPLPPQSRNNLWFATCCELSKVVSAEKIKVLFPKFVLP